MKKFSISNLELARRKPDQFAKTLRDNDDEWKGGKSKYSAWKLAVYEYHKSKNVSHAINYFEATYMRWFADNTRNIRERETYIMILQAYLSDYLKLGLTYLDHRRRIEIVLSPKLKITGEIPIVSLSSDSGYTAHFFTKDSTAWNSELKYPIIQSFVADFYGVDLAEVEVGVFGLDAKRHKQLTYSGQEVANAQKELRSIGRAITRVI